MKNVSHTHTYRKFPAETKIFIMSLPYGPSIIDDEGREFKFKIKIENDIPSVEVRLNDCVRIIPDDLAHSLFHGVGFLEYIKENKNTKDLFISIPLFDALKITLSIELCEKISRLAMCFESDDGIEIEFHGQKLESPNKISTK